MTARSAMTVERLLHALPLGTIDADALELADAVWLAEHMMRSGQDCDMSGAGEHRDRRDADRSRGTSASSPGPDASPPPRTPLYLAGPEPGPEDRQGAGTRPGRVSTRAPADGGHRVKVPAQAALPRQSDYLGALRDFKLLEPSGRPTEFDEEATIDASARSGTLLVRTRPRSRPRLAALCVLDAGRSMPPWYGTATDFARLVEASGVFSDIEVVIMAEDGALSSPPRRSAPAAVRNGPRATFVFTDGVGAGWQRTSVLRHLAQWARGGPTALINPLPERLWGRTALRPVHGAVAALTAAAPNTEMRFRAYGGAARTAVERIRASRGGRLTPIPVLELEPERIAQWAAFVRTPSADGFACGLSFPTPRPVAAGDRPAPAAAAPDPGKLFLATASPAAVRLAAHLAALNGWINLPIMRYVQDIAVPESGPTHLAEVLLGGLLEPDRVPAPPLRLRYRFTTQARRQLLRLLPLEADEWLADRIAQRISRAADNVIDWFPALVGTSDPAADPVADAPFARARPDVVHRLAPVAADPAEQPRPAPSEAEIWSDRAQRAHERFRDSGRMEDLDEALGHRVAALTHASADERPRYSHQLGEHLVYRWLFSFDPRDLERAVRALGIGSTHDAEPPGGGPYLVERLLMADQGSELRYSDTSVTTPAIRAAYQHRAQSLKLRDSPGDPPAGALLAEAARLAREVLGSPDSRAESGLALLTLAAALSGAPATPDPSPDDAAEAIEAFQEAMTMVTEDGAPLPAWSREAARRALALARAEGGREALDWAVGQLRGSAVRGSVVDAERAPLLADLATALRIRFDRDNSPGDLAEAILHLRTVLGQDRQGGQLLPDDERARCLRELGRALEERYALDHRPTELGEAAECYRQASELAGPELAELHASCLVGWGRVLIALFRYDDAREKLTQGVAAYTAIGLAGHDMAVTGKRLLAELDSEGR